MSRIAKSEFEKLKNKICRRIRHFYDDIRRERGIDYHQAALTLGFSCAATLLNRFRRPGRFTLDELGTIANAMNISLETLVSGKEA